MITTAPQPSLPERHEREQYFFDAGTVREWAAVASRFENPCLLCAPTVGAELQGRAAILDTDERFVVYPGFRRWDLNAPTYLPTRFGVILCDPPFFAISLGRLAAAIDLLSAYDPAQPLALTYLKRREQPLLRALARYNLHPTDSRPRYRSVDTSGRNEIEVYANFPWMSLGAVQRSPA